MRNQRYIDTVYDRNGAQGVAAPAARTGSCGRTEP